MDQSNNKSHELHLFTAAFRMLNDELSKIGETMVLTCAGGYVLQINGYRATADVDAFYKSNAAIDDAIQNVGDALGINKPDELWLNNSIANMNPEPPDEYCETAYSFSNLIVKTVNIYYMVGMKLISARSQDIIDLSDIFRRRKDMQPLPLLSDLTSMGFEIDISILLNAFENAHGMEWLGEYYKNNEAELRRLF